MALAVKFIGLLIIIMGAVFLFRPEAIRKLWAFFEKDKRLYLAGAVRIIFGIIFLLSASQCRLRGFIAVLGLLFLLSGMLIFFIGPDKIKVVLRWWSEKPLFVLRLAAIMIIGLGVLIVYAV